MSGVFRAADHGRSWGPLAERDFRNLYVARALSLLGDAVVPVALAFAVLGIEDSASALGTVLAARTLALVAFLLVGGVAADRMSRKSVLIASDAVRLVAHGVMAVLVITGRAEIWHLVALSFLFGVGWALFLPTSTAFVPETVSPGRLQQANALIASTFSLTQVVGPAVAGVLVVAVGAGWALAVDAATFLVSALFVARITRRRAAPRPSSRAVDDLRQGWREFRSRTWLWVDGVYAAVTAAVVFPAFHAVGPLIARRDFEGAASWAIVLTATGVGSALGGAMLLRFRPRRPLLAGVPPLMLLSLPLFLLAWTQDPLVVAAGALLGGLGLTVFNTLFETTVQQHVPSEALSRVAAIDWFLSQGLQPLGYALVGPAVATFGLETPLVAAGLWVIATTLVVLAVPEARSLESRPLQSAVRDDPPDR